MNSFKFLLSLVEQ